MTERRNYGTGGITQRKDGRWVGTIEAGWTEQGKRKRTSVTGKTKGEVERKLRNKNAEIAKAEGQVSSGAMLRKTVKAWSDEWLTIRETAVRPKTYDIDRAAVRKWIVPAIGAKRLIDLAPRDVRATHARQRAAGLALDTIGRNHRALLKMLRDARQEGYVVPENVTAAPGPGKGENDRQAMETVEAVAVMHHAADLPHGARYFVAFYQGLRQGEALGLTWDAIDFATNTIAVEWQLQALPYLDKADRAKGFRIPHGYVARHLKGRFHLVRPKTSKGFRVIPMVPEIRQLLSELHSARTETVGNLVWTRPNGWPIDKADDATEFRSLQDAAGVKHPAGRFYVGHEMRNTTAQLLLEAGVDPVVITAILGHSNWATSVGYMKARAGSLRGAMEQVATAFRPKEIG